jgi:hypothetical protein
MRNLTKKQSNVLEAQAIVNPGAKVIGWHEDHNGPVIYVPTNGLRAAVTPNGGFRRIS